DGRCTEHTAPSPDEIFGSDITVVVLPVHSPQREHRTWVRGPAADGVHPGVAAGEVDAAGVVGQVAAAVPERCLLDLGFWLVRVIAAAEPGSPGAASIARPTQ
ncbi:hypothetical protein, partial [Streptomyces sp. MBT70]|uniref:hypothetical protein n=1 Tax=Streptomyces sp. MBT70 TaxID=1488400 RepID=UPI001F173557